MTLSRQVRRRVERTGQLPEGMSWTPMGEPTFHAEDGREIDTSVGTFEVRKPVVGSLGAMGIAALVLSGCATAPLVRPDTPLADRIPASLLQCADRPVAGSLERQSDVARFVVELDAAGEDCRGKVSAVRQIVESER